MRGDTYGVEAAGAGEIPDTQDTAMYLEEVGYTPDTWIAVADTRTNRVPPAGTSKAAEAKRWGSSHRTRTASDQNNHTLQEGEAVAPETAPSPGGTALSVEKSET